MKTRIKRFILLLLVGYTVVICRSGWAFTLGTENQPNPNRPILIVSADKMDNQELLNSDSPAILKLLNEGAVGLMTIRTGAGYTTENGYLTLGAGGRSFSSGKQGGAFESSEILLGGSAASYWEWSYGLPAQVLNNKLVVPEIGLELNQTEGEDDQFSPGLMVKILHENGWKTFLVGNSDSINVKKRSGGLLIMDQFGLIDGGNINSSINERDEAFPYHYRFSVSKVFREVKSRVLPKNLILVEFGDFARLDNYRDLISPNRFQKLKYETWLRFDQFIGEILKTWSPDQLGLVVVSPSVSKEALVNKDLLAPIVIRAMEYPAGLLSSGTTNWESLVANIDFLPTVLKLAHLQTNYFLVGRMMKTETAGENDHLIFLNRFYHRILAITQNQRSLLDCYLGLISSCWIAGLVGIYLRKAFISNWLLTGVATVPLILLILPFFPDWFWQPGWLIFFTVVGGLVLSLVKNLNKRFLILTGFLWTLLIWDQFTGWNLIRYSGLGYSAMAGARYYGMGNEYMGIFIAVSLLFAYLVNRALSWKWLSPALLGLSCMVIGWPQLGANFGGLLGALPGFIFFLILLYNWRIKSWSFQMLVIGCFLVIFLFGWWDSSRNTEFQTHIGKFFQLVFRLDLSKISTIIIRKMEMNLRLIVFSPWIRIIYLTGLMAVINKVVTGISLVSLELRGLWYSILISGLTAFMVNDSGVVAFATCLAFGFSYIMLNKINSVLEFPPSGISKDRS